ncbi:MAG TPA: DUF418 domain-containing protein [Chryseolinea sp.]|nr:DUF418 domain-containing protein [Chryseolinea sp.]
MEQSTVLPPLEPLSESERITIIDSLRGIALLGILMMNIPSFGYPFIQATNPMIAGELGTINFKIWYFVEGFLEGTQRGLFSMLFGCGVIVFTTRLEKRVNGIMPAELFLRRQLWLLLFGLFNAFVLLWSGDILYHYAILGILLFAFRRMKPSHLIIAAIVCLALQTARENRDLYQSKRTIEKGEAIAAIDTTKTKLNDKQKGQLEEMNGFKNNQKLEKKQKKAKETIEAVQGSYAELYERLSNDSVWMETDFMYYNPWDVLIFMFLGLAFFKMGLMQGDHPLMTYLIIAIVGLGVGIVLSYFRLKPLIETQFNFFDYTKDASFTLYEIPRTFRSVGLFGLIMVLYKTGWFNWLFALVRPVGQMAFTNYLMQSLICGLIFYGVGFGLYGELQRYELYYIVGSVWIFQIIVSHIWLRYYRFGPMEWVWRSLTYWKLQPFKKRAASEIVFPSVQPGN